MKDFLRKCRGILGMGVTWGVVWGAVFAALSLIVGLVDPDVIDPGEGPIPVAGIGAIFGFVSGSAFGLLLSLAEGRKAIAELSTGRAAVFGALGTALFPLLTPVDNSMLIILCPIGAGLAAATVALAKRAELAAAAEQPKLTPP
ncbi:MAG TPA: hypothetical protein VJ816_06240 [Gemmatimonadales bacterium]|nr:hypothetical protein [Gemmatimonadales bacterium]